MRETIATKVMKIDRDMRSAVASYAVAATIFGAVSIIRIILLLDTINIFNLIFFVLIFGVFILCIRAILRVREMRKMMSEDPKSFMEAKGPRALSLRTFFPFT